MDTTKVAQGAKVASDLIATLLPVSEGVLAQFPGPVTAAVVGGLLTAQALLGIANAFIFKLPNGGTITIDVSKLTDDDAILKALQADLDAGWPKLTFGVSDTTPVEG